MYTETQIRAAGISGEISSIDVEHLINILRKKHKNDSSNEEKLAEKFLMKFMKENPLEVVKWVLIKLGQEMYSSHAETMRIEQDSYLAPNERYKVVCKIKITKIKTLKNKTNE